MFTKELLHTLYDIEGLTDREIASRYNVDRTTVIYNRNKHGIKTRVFPHDFAVEAVMDKLVDEGFLFENKKENNKTFGYDLSVGGKRVKVISSNLSKEGRYKYCLTSKEENKNVKSEYRIKLPNGRFKILLPKVCDILICVGIEGADMHFWIIPTEALEPMIQSLSIKVVPENKYFQYYENWRELGTVNGLLVG